MCKFSTIMSQLRMINSVVDTLMLNSFSALMQSSDKKGGMCQCLAPRKSFDILALYKSDYYYYYKITGGATTTTIILRSFVRDYPGEPVPEETLTYPPSWSSSNLYQLLPSTTIHSILPVQITCLAIFLHNLFPCPLFWSTSWSAVLNLIFHTFLHPISVFFSQHMPMPSQPVLL